VSLPGACAIPILGATPQPDWSFYVSFIKSEQHSLIVQIRKHFINKQFGIGHIRPPVGFYYKALRRFMSNAAHFRGW
jgi:hypothetical protein